MSGGDIPFLKADRILVVKDGIIAEQGSHEELLSLGGVYKSLYETQFRQVLDMQGAEPKEDLEWEEKNMIQNDVY